MDQRKLDDYINLPGELVIARNALVHAYRQFESEPTAGVRHLKGAIDAVQRIASRIQDNAMAMRMVPVGTVFQRFPRVVRDIAKSQGKKIQVHIFGEDTEIDKQVAEALVDPLLHLVRNAADHGIEPPDQRRGAGKSETGLITLKAAREGNSIVIDAIDDGKGIDVERLKAKAVEQDVLSEERARALAPKDALQLVFAPGLSTARRVTDVSGRGVGMDVVRTNINQLGGTVLVDSEPGAGTQFRIQLPLTLAVTTVLLVRSQGQRYALPIEVVRETVKLEPRAIQRLKGHRAIALRGELVVVKPLAELLAERAAPDTRRAAPEPMELDATGRIPVVVVEAGGAPLGLAVGSLEGQQEIVLKPLPPYLAKLPGLGSATVMGDGTIVLVLDPSTLWPATMSKEANGARRT